MNEEYRENRTKLNEQLTELMPLIEIERSAYIHSEHGRLQAIIGTGYWCKEIDDSEIFHGRKGDDLALIEDRPKDPYDITIEELYWITLQYKHIERCGTDSYLNFFNMLPEDKERMKLLSGMWHKMTHETLCTDQEIKALKEGHEAFLARMTGVPVKVIK
ncbi:MAG: hypothetical protein IJF96_05180 [Firmicutes bacterium]|nr:hypothetical protein [Bacillota bacterium]